MRLFITILGILSFIFFYLFTLIVKMPSLVGGFTCLCLFLYLELESIRWRRKDES